jgi:hypothetical protein
VASVTQEDWEENPEGLDWFASTFASLCSSLFTVLMLRHKTKTMTGAKNRLKIGANVSATNPKKTHAMPMVRPFQRLSDFDMLLFEPSRGLRPFWR